MNLTRILIDLILTGVLIPAINHLLKTNGLSIRINLATLKKVKNAGNRSSAEERWKASRDLARVGRQELKLQIQENKDRITN